ncbi:hypothetical protein [Deinococcus sedimenti]|uniref:Uncharacterized protein n=1 Tax=Deinococcus sedimenti TaxID=1867090 RepID=A0ABQ2S946_9DEIO|nr:hypothetical protein [Deinococcus sedimenti]GGS01484.1 hypothetical protein GCM10008960_30240 [Deinococcus sedimenti]
MRTSFTVLALLALTGPASAAGTVTLPDGVVVKEDLPGYPRGNGGSFQGHDNKVLVCHATSAVDTNGYVVVSISAQAFAAHLRHEHQQQTGGKEQRDRLYFNGLTCTLPPS